ncbi:MAG: DUF4388 domain-containing protein, partial [Candidatus Rokuibacteriota bacterium]
MAALSGSLREFHLSEIVQLLSGQRKTGCLTLTSEKDEVCLYFDEGRLCGVRPPGLSDRDPLMLFLRRTRWLSEEQLRGVESLHAESGRDLVDILLKGRYVDSEDLTAVYERMAIDLLFRLLSWEDAQYSFAPGPVPESTMKVTFSTDAMLMESVRRVDEHKRYLRELPEAHEIPGLRELPDPDAELSEYEKEIFALVDGNRTVAEIVATAPLCDFEALEGLSNLFDNKWLEIVGSREVGGARVERKTEKTAPKRKPLEWVLVGGIAFGLVGLVVATMPMRFHPPTEVGHPGTDPHERARMADIRAALAVYRHETGQFPSDLSE